MKTEHSIQSVIDYIEDHLREELSLEQIAEKAFVSGLFQNLSENEGNLEYL